MTGVSSASTCAPDGSPIVVDTRAVTVVGPALATVGATSMAAWASSTSSVVTGTPSTAMCTGGFTCRTSERCSPAPEYHRESRPLRVPIAR